MWKTFIGNFNFEHRIGVEYLRSKDTNLTLSNTKQGTDLGAFDQTFHLLHVWLSSVKEKINICMKLAKIAF